MFTHPHVGAQLVHERQLEMLARANQHLLVQYIREHGGATQRLQRAVPRLSRLFRRIRPAALPS